MWTEVKFDHLLIMIKNKTVSDLLNYRRDVLNRITETKKVKKEYCNTYFEENEQPHTGAQF